VDKKGGREKKPFKTIETLDINKTMKKNLDMIPSFMNFVGIL
jgi:hypothetical protein